MKCKEDFVSELENEIKKIELELMFNKQTNFTFFDLMSATRKFNDITIFKKRATRWK